MSSNLIGAFTFKILKPKRIPVHFAGIQNLRWIFQSETKGKWKEDEYLHFLEDAHVPSVFLYCWTTKSSSEFFQPLCVSYSRALSDNASQYIILLLGNVYPRKKT